jgi:hypothetical protein
MKRPSLNRGGIAWAIFTPMGHAIIHLLRAPVDELGRPQKRPRHCSPFRLGRQRHGDRVEHLFAHAVFGPPAREG